MIRSAILARAAGMSVSALRATLSIERLHFDRYLELRARGVPILFALWHGRMFLPIQIHRRQGIVTMASRSEDGDIIARWLERNGYRVVRGSTSRGGGEALRQMVREIRGGRHAALTVDGPQGPPRAVQAGVLQLARLTGARILPITYSCTRPIFLKSWDRYLLPRPFARCVVVWGEPLVIGEELPDKAALSRIADALDAATAEADAAVGVEPPPPWRSPRPSDP
jgi:lysophospholipid acyltransferase (LPLAT)-like uncharacterized protein